MKLHKLSKSISLSAIGFVLALSSLHADPCPCAPGNFYLGAFGGIASSNNFNINQYGTAFYTEAAGGPLAVNAFGTSKSNTTGIVGGQVGYQWLAIPFNCGWSIIPAIELEGIYLTKSNFTANDVNNNTDRLDEHNFSTTYPTKVGVFLTNAVFNLDSCSLHGFRPYVGVGFGGAVASITGATATQISPPEPGVNHFNSNSSDTAATFAGQAKIGVSYDFCRNFGAFAEYRWLYLSSTSYAFGSTVSPGHVATSNWQVKMDPRSYNIGTIGLRFNL